MLDKVNPTGMATDSSGGPVIDPTFNVIALNDAAVRRQDDLREMESKYNRRLVKSENDHIREIVHMRANVADLRAQHSEALRIAEAHRLDAILTNASDTAQFTAAAAETRATTLANTVALSADAMRAQVATTAQASNETLDRRFGPIQASIEEIRKFQFETQGGRVQVHESQAKSSNWGLWIGVGIAVFSAFVAFNGMLLGVVGVAVTIFLTRG